MSPKLSTSGTATSCTTPRSVRTALSTQTAARTHTSAQAALTMTLICSRLPNAARPTDKQARQAQQIQPQWSLRNSKRCDGSRLGFAGFFSVALLMYDEGHSLYHADTWVRIPTKQAVCTLGSMHKQLQNHDSQN